MAAKLPTKTARTCSIISPFSPGRLLSGSLTLGESIDVEYAGYRR